MHHSTLTIQCQETGTSQDQAWNSQSPWHKAGCGFQSLCSPAGTGRLRVCSSDVCRSTAFATCDVCRSSTCVAATYVEVRRVRRVPFATFATCDVCDVRHLRRATCVATTYVADSQFLRDIQNLKVDSTYVEGDVV